MDYHITGDNITVDTQKLGQPDGTNYYLDGKGDSITVTNGNVMVGPGDATITATDSRSAACFWSNAKVGINLNLQTGSGTSSQGGVVHLIGVHQIQGTYLNDQVIGGSGDLFFWGNGGVDFFQGGTGLSTLGLKGLIGNYSIKVSLDGVNATVTNIDPSDSNYRSVTTLVNVQMLSVWNPLTASSISYDVTSFITDQDKALQGLLPPSPDRWNFGHELGSAVSVTYSFTAGALSSGAQAAISSILAETSSQVGIDFVMVSTGGQINFNALAQTDGLGTVMGTPSGGSGHCEVTLNSDVLSDISTATAGYQALLHEIGAALGLKDANAPVAGNGATVLTAADDFTINTVMSYNAFDDVGGYRDNWGRLDLIALQSLYGARATHTGNDTYVLNDATGLTLHTLVDNGGANTLDASGCTFGVTLNLNAGTLSSAGVTAQGTAAFDNLALSASTAIQSVMGSPQDDVLIGNQFDNTFFPGTGNDQVQGGAGRNTVVLKNAWGDYLVSDDVSSGAAVLTLQSADGVSGTLTCSEVQTYQFNDALLQLSGSSATLSLNAAGTFAVGQGMDFGRIVGTAGADTANFSGHLADYTVSFNGASQLSVVSDSAASRNGSNTLMNFERLQFADYSINLTAPAMDASIAASSLTRIEELYVAFFNRVPDADGLAYWVGQFKGGQTINQIAASFYAVGVQYASLTGFSSSMTNTNFINLVYKNVLGRKDGADPGGLDYWNVQLSAGVARGQLVSTMLDAAHTYKEDAIYSWVANLLDNKIEVAQTVAVTLALNFNTPVDSITQGMAIAAAVTPTDTQVALNLMGLNTDALLLTLT